MMKHLTLFLVVLFSTTNTIWAGTEQNQKNLLKGFSHLSLVHNLVENNFVEITNFIYHVHFTNLDVHSKTLD